MWSVDGRLIITRHVCLCARGQHHRTRPTQEIHQGDGLFWPSKQNLPYFPFFLFSFSLVWNQWPSWRRRSFRSGGENGGGGIFFFRYVSYLEARLSSKLGKGGNKEELLKPSLFFFFFFFLKFSLTKQNAAGNLLCTERRSNVFKTPALWLLRAWPLSLLLLEELKTTKKKSHKKKRFYRRPFFFFTLY